MTVFILTRTSVTAVALLVVADLLAEEESMWQQTAALQDPDAFQAAAADSKFFYAINNATIAKIDRRTKKRVAVSSGEAKHLNGGFFFRGKMFCAHSNYPRSPEISQIKVLDVQTMKLKTYHDFGNFGGSLTWAVRHDGHWWCNFAKYGADNEDTFLVKFTDAWTEVARWTYPQTLISQLGRYSLSGGLWMDSQLLVTGHDDPVVFRLKLPKDGSVLHLVAKQSVPFHGQGFAVDPASGGLVGIVRATRQVVACQLVSRKNATE